MPDKADANAPHLDAAARRVGAVVIAMGREAGFDRLIAHRGRLYAVEYKSPAHPPSHRGLTPGEAKRQVQLAGVGVTLYVVLQPADLLAVLNG